MCCVVLCVSTLVASSYRQLPVVTWKEAVLTLRGKGTVTTTSSKAKGLCEDPRLEAPDSSNECTGLVPNVSVRRALTPAPLPSSPLYTNYTHIDHTLTTQDRAQGAAKRASSRSMRVVCLTCGAQ